MQCWPAVPSLARAVGAWCVAGVAVTAAPAWHASAPDTIVFRHVAAVDLGAGLVRPDMAVAVAQGWITRVAPDSATLDDTWPAGATTVVVDGRSNFLIPGLWESHVHLTKLGPGAFAAFVTNGVTSVRDMGSDLTEVARWRREIAAGARPGPRIKTAGSSTSAIRAGTCCSSIACSGRATRHAPNVSVTALPATGL